MRNKIFLNGIFSLITLIFFISFISALNCNFPSSQININTGGTPTPISITCSNSGSSSVQLWNQGSFFTTSPSFSSTSPLTINQNNSQSFNIIFNQINSAGLFTGSFWSSDGLFQNIYVNSTQSNPTGCQINPSMSSYTQTAQTGTVTPLPKITFSPTNCAGSIIYDSSHIYMEGGIISGGIRKPVSITSIVSDGVNLEINTEGLNSQTYTSTLKVSAFSKTFEIPFVIIVTSGNSQQGNFSADNLPTCSLNSITLNMNQSYSLTCSNLQTDVSIIPSIDNNFIKGTGLSTSSNSYVWNFMAKKIGTTNISACFYYLGSPIGNCFNQGVQITNSGTSVLGSTTLDFVFYQDSSSVDKDSLKAMDTIINVVDNSTRNLITEAKLYLNGVEINTTKTLEIGDNYELRATAYGYTDKVINFNVSSAKLTISLDPSKEIYYMGESINITSNIENVTFLLDDLVISSPYTFVSEGNFILKAQKEGYISSEVNLTINPPVTYQSLSPIDFSKWKKGTKVVMKLTEDSIWNVYYEEESRDSNGQIIYKEPVLISSGLGSDVSFEIGNYGYYEVKSRKDISFAENSVLKNLVTTKNFNLSQFWNDYYIWIISVIGLLIVTIVFIVITRGKNSEKSSSLPFGGSPSSAPSDMESNADIY